jgi:hypothetical protein
MDTVLDPDQSQGEQRAEKGPGAAGLPAFAESLAQQIVRVEANFLRLPLFTLDNKRMRSMDGLQCEGTFRRGDKSYDFSYAVTRNTATYYPGPLARSAHFALLSMASDRGLPIKNPVTFTWRELCARMGIQANGQIVRSLREALTATKGLMIESRTALFSKVDNAPINTDERGQVVNLYDQLEFFGTTRSDGSSADINGVWLSDWYLGNLNALYSGPLDYILWRGLNEKSPIASRLYEFLFFKFFGGHDLLRFNYPTLVRFIPARTERYLSSARRQLQPAFDLLLAAGILRAVQWVESSGGHPQILFHRGPLLSSAPSPAESYDVGDEDFTLRRIEDIQLPEWRFVTAFHEAWGNRDIRPAKAEVELARELIAMHGDSVMQEVLPRLVKRLRLRWSEAKTFCAVSRYLPEVLKEYQGEKNRAQRERQEADAEAKARKQSIRQAQDKAVLKAMWESLPLTEQEEIRQTVLAHQPRNIEKFSGIVERFCLEELAKRKNVA